MTPATHAAALLAERTTLRVGGPAQRLRETASEAEFIAALREADDAGQNLLVLGGGSNVVIADEGFAGDVVTDGRREITVLGLTEHEVRLRVPAGQPWDDVVARAVDEGWSGIEALSGIPGSSGATPVQNVGAYGQEIAERLTGVTVWDRQRRTRMRLGPAQLELGYRTSQLKRSISDPIQAWGPTPRHVVLDVDLTLVRHPESQPVRYGELARALGVEVGQRAPLAEVRRAVLALRRGKGMVLDAADHDTWSAGSFFTNPVLSASAAGQLPADAPRYPVLSYSFAADGTPTISEVAGEVKTSAAWLLTRAGFDRGYGMPGPAALSSKHALAITNRGGANAADVAALARELRDGVRDRFGVELLPEPVFIGLSLAG
ncbi:MAG TPA: UDP-N-acetylmuramate dehydrogenase [Actinomycetaceae bacterium]|nr:UDP-N-acetylmuramate dehydrogenase [Actinomycetaceae bacterium]